MPVSDSGHRMIPADSFGLHPVFGEPSRFADPDTEALFLGGLPDGLGAVIVHTAIDNPGPLPDGPGRNVDEAHVVVNDQVLFWLDRPATKETS